MKGIIVGGESGRLLVRGKSGSSLEVGEILVSENKNKKIFLQVMNLSHGSQLSIQNKELSAGMFLEENSDVYMMDSAIRHYPLAEVKNLVVISNGRVKLEKGLSPIFSKVRGIMDDDLSFLPNYSLFVGNLRSGSFVLDKEVSLPIEKTFSHHILIQGTTGRGKSVLVKDMLWGTIPINLAGVLILDPHDEYYGRSEKGFKDHFSGKVSYFTPSNPPPGSFSLKLSISLIKPAHFQGVVNFSDVQKQTLQQYYSEYKSEWIESILLEKECKGFISHEGTVNALKRKLLSSLSLSIKDNVVSSLGIFAYNGGDGIIKEILSFLEKGETVIVDTSSLSSVQELLIGSIISSEILRRYKRSKQDGKISSLPVQLIVLEEAPRVLGKEALEKGSNIFATIAREGRKFKVGLCAITQLPSLIPKSILANLNTKIILGTEMKSERQAIIDSAAHDLSSDDRAIASLDIGEAIVTSTFMPFPLPVKLPFFENFIDGDKKEEKISFKGVGFN